MTQVDVIALAREAGAAELLEKPHFVGSKWRLNGGLERFAQLVAEECAKRATTIANDLGEAENFAARDAADYIAGDIRAKFAAKVPS